MHVTKTRLLLTASAVAVAFAATSAWAKVPADQAARLGKDLTPMGGEMAGTADGSVPAWTGGLTAPPAGVKFDAKTQNPPNPFPGDQPKFTVNAGNAGQYANQLLDGYKQLMKLYPSYHMNVYQSRRTCSLPNTFMQRSRTMRPWAI
jgi:folylpolyglutamate synthase/dihydropteroate synthase